MADKKTARIAGYICFVFSVRALRRIFKPVNNLLTRLMMAFVLAGVAVAFICKFAQAAVTIFAIEAQGPTAELLLDIYT